ncbi:MAG: hypothetical protein IJ033_04830, partial [Clostridia bacterium]|nr:hypothetical protein [Clostridia bacterium]
MRKVKVFTIFLLIILLLSCLGGCFDNTNLSSEDIAELNQYKKERKNSVNRFAEKAKELFDFNEEGLAKVS